MQGRASIEMRVPYSNRDGQNPRIFNEIVVLIILVEWFSSTCGTILVIIGPRGHIIETQVNFDDGQMPRIFNNFAVF